MILHDHVLSAGCYKVRLMAALLGVRLDLQAVDFHPGCAHKTPQFRALNPAGTLPVFQDGGLTLTDSAAILTWLAHGTAWLPTGKVPQAQTQHWLAFATRLGDSLGMARLHDMLLFPADIAACRKAGLQALRELEAHLTEARFRGEGYLLGESPTIADIACFPAVALAPDGGVSLDDFASTRLWTRAIRSLPGFIEMPGIHRLHDLNPDPFAKPAQSA